MSASRSIGIVGAGFTGLSAAYELARAGHDVTIYEAENDIGGLAGTFELQPGVRIEKFYHHWFTSDRAVLGFIEELGLTSHIRFLTTNTGLYYTNTIFRLASPLDLLRFTPIPFIDRVRTGLMALRARRISNWKPLEDITAEDWLQKHGGKRAFQTIWYPLLKGKFGPEAPAVSAVWIWNKLKLRGSSRDEKGAESLVYFGGGFGALTDRLRAALEKIGVKILTNQKVRRIESSGGRVTGLDTEGGFKSHERVLATLPLPTFLSMTPDLPASYREKHSQIRFLGNVCLVLRLNRSLSSTYWLNVADPSFPFVGVIEHTNLDDPKNYGGERIAYLSTYLPTSDARYKMSPDEFFAYCLPYLKKIFPAFERDWVNGFACWRAEFSQPVITKRYSELIPPDKTPIEGLWLSTMAQVYPEDRGTNYAVREGRRVGKLMAL